MISEEKMLKRKVKQGSLWLDSNWEEAISKTIKIPGCYIRKVMKWKNPNRILDDEKVFSHYEMRGFENGREYKIRIPKTLNKFVERKLKEKENEI